MDLTALLVMAEGRDALPTVLGGFAIIVGVIVLVALIFGTGIFTTLRRRGRS